MKKIKSYSANGLDLSGTTVFCCAEIAKILQISSALEYKAQGSPIETKLSSTKFVPRTYLESARPIASRRGAESNERR